MTKIVLTFKDESFYEIDCENVEVSAFRNWYSNDERKLNDSINLNQIHKEDDIILNLRQIAEDIGDNIITKVVWQENEQDVLCLDGNIEYSWNLNANPNLVEVLNFTVE